MALFSEVKLQMHFPIGGCNIINLFIYEKTCKMQQAFILIKSPTHLLNENQLYFKYGLFFSKLQFDFIFYPRRFKVT